MQEIPGSILASDGLRVITWPGYWPLIGPEWSRDQDIGQVTRAHRGWETLPGWNGSRNYFYIAAVIFKTRGRLHYISTIIVMCYMWQGLSNDSESRPVLSAHNRVVGFSTMRVITVCDRGQPVWFICLEGWIINWGDSSPRTLLVSRLPYCGHIILASDWPRVITWPGCRLLIGPDCHIVVTEETGDWACRNYPCCAKQDGLLVYQICLIFGSITCLHQLWSIIIFVLYSLLLPDFWMKVKDFMFRGNLGFCDTEVILMVILQSVRGIIIWDMKQFHFIITNSSSLLVVGQNHQPGWFDQIVGWSQYNGHFNTIFTN